MDGGTVKIKKNPYLTANPLSQLFFSWIGALFSLANKKKKLTSEDLDNIPPSDESQHLGDRLEREWDKELQKQKLGKAPNLNHALVRLFGPAYAFLGIFVLVEEGLRVAQPLLLGQLINYFSPNVVVEEWQAYLYAAGVSLCALLLALVHSPFFFGLQRLAMKIRVSLCTLVYRKVLRLDNTSVQQSSSGQVNNLMTNDVNRFDMALISLHYLWVCPLQAAVIFGLLWMEIGWACLPGYGVLILLLPIQAGMSKLFSKLRRKTAAHTDKRVAVMTEIINAMRVIKMYAWEVPFGEMVQKIRKAEIRKIIQASYPMGINLILSLYGNRLLDVFMIITYALTATEIRVSTTFVIVAYCAALRGSFMRFFLRAVQLRSECLVSIKRIQKFMLLKEISLPPANSSVGHHDNPGVHVQGLSGSWDENLENATLHNINFDVKKGELLAVVGPVGSGKSTLLMSLLKELPTISGKVKIDGRVAYASQEPWNFSGTIRQNITFGREFNKRKYDKIVEVCALSKDIKCLPGGDLTMIGERGVTLSGGQKARVSLARALYDDADIYLLDDPLSAVDSEVGRHIFDKCIMEYLADKPRILVTHQLQFLTTASKILVLKEGHMEAVGPLSELHQKGIDFASLMKQEEEDEEEDLEEVAEERPGLRKRRSTKRSIKSQSSVNDRPAAPAGKAFKEEQAKKGDVTLSVYYKYFKSGANCLTMFFLVVFFLGTQIAYILSDLWLAFWTEEEEKKQAMNESMRNLTQMMLNGEIGTDQNGGNNILSFNLDVTTDRAAYIYGIFVAVVFLLAIFRSLVTFNVMIKSSRNLHNRMFKAVIRSPVLFFDTNPAGRILNRFTKDIGLMDDQLPLTFFDFLQISLYILGTVILTVIINYFVLILVVPLTVIFLFLRRYALVATRAIKRLDGITRSPVFSHTTTSFHGLSTIRAYNKQAQFMTDFNHYQDQHSETWFAFLAANRWFGLRLDLIMIIFITGVAVGSVPLKDVLDAGLVAVILSNSISLGTIFQFVVRQSALVENQMTSVERTIEYTKLEPEAPLNNRKKQPPTTWPQFGAITFNNMSLNYATEGPRVLKNLICSIMAKEKVGIVGRTGAGKSSLITALFRLAEPSGVIMLDGVTTSELGLHDVRKKLSIIPQDPVLFTGSLRYNLDPFNRYSDIEIWNALDDVQLRPVVQDSAKKLNMAVGESGSNFSVGQRQLICLARAILRQNRVLILDEATANVDPRTDALIQQTIRTKFQNCTVLTIAHRLNTIMDSDRIMVLDAGEIVEFDQPHTLLQRPGGLLSKLVEQTGRSEANELMDTARQHFKLRRVTGVNNVTFASPEELTVEGYQQQLHNWGTANSANPRKFTESIGVQTEPFELRTVLLPKTVDGYGFSVAGSTDNPYMPIFVVQVVEGSPASFPYALQVGDEILGVNGHDRSKLTYADVCRLIKDSKERIQLLVKRRSNGKLTTTEFGKSSTAEIRNKNKPENKEFQGSPFPTEKQAPTQGNSEQPTECADLVGTSSMGFTNEGFEDALLSVEVNSGNDTASVQPEEKFTLSGLPAHEVLDTKL